MSSVALIGVMMWLVLAVDKARLNQIKSNHIHVWLNDDDPASAPMGAKVLTTEQFGFWHSYFRTLLGLPWDWRTSCNAGDGPSEFACARDHPEIFRPTPLGTQIEFHWEVVRSAREGRARPR